jgi:threonyl-tRNA synthetase
MGIIIEHTAGNFPVWMAPIQAAVIPVRDTHNEAAQAVVKSLLSQSVRVDFMNDDENFGKKIRAAKNMKVPYTIIIGDKDIEAGKVTLESRDNGNLGQLDAAEVVAKLVSEIKERK